MSLSASKYSVVLVLASSKAKENLVALFRDMESRLVQKMVQKVRERAQGNGAPNVD
jgi:hypothetical protein